MCGVVFLSVVLGKDNFLAKRVSTQLNTIELYWLGNVTNGPDGTSL